MNFKQNLKQIRKSRGLTQEELANKMNGTKFAIRNYEQGVREPNLEQLERLKIALECSYDDLLS